ncbi:TolC family protein [candidate division CSSED10-310 bacterium]|uniref:TolC family protein n=1 Tax=candidate division CSSED10-310 bacterium TaxID=2855610 RepID=A0ABV6YUI9_UNCC1
MKKMTLVVLILCLFSLPSEATVLTLEECIAQAVERNPALHQARARYEAALAQSKVVRTQRWPSFKAQLSYFRLSDVDPFSVETPLGMITIAEPILDVYQGSLSVQQPVFTGFRLVHNIEMAQKNAQISRLQVDTEQWDLQFEVIKAYYRVINSRSTRKFIAESIKTMQAHVTDVRNFREAGVATTNDVLQSEVLLSNLQIQLNRAENAVALADLLLNTLLNRADFAAVEIDEQLTISPTPTIALETLLGLAFQQRLELRQLDAQRDVTQHIVAIARSDYYPTVLAAGVYSYAQPNSRYQPPEEEFNGDWSIGLTMSITPFDWGKTRQRIQQAQAQQREIEARTEQVRLLIRSEVTQTYLQKQEAERRLELVRTTVTQAQENLKVAHDQYKEGMNRNTDVLDAEILVLQANLDQTQAEIDYLITSALLRKAVGSEPVENR